MIIRFPNESHFEATTIDRLELLGYEHQDGKELRENPDFSLDAVVQTDTLRRHLRARYPRLPDQAIETAIRQAINPDGVSLLHRNRAFHQLLTRGFDVKYKTPADEERYEHLYLVNWDEPARNDFSVVSQLPIHGANDRRPDLIVYVNGLPLVVFELKNPYDENPTVEGAYNQIQHYARDIPQLFDFNAFCVISDGVTTLHGMHSADMTWFAPWKSIDGRTVEPAGTATMKSLIEGLFTKERLLDYIRNFILFESVNEVIAKKGAKYHQFFGVRFAVEQALRATQPDGDRKIGVIWHTPGVGKSLEMIFFVGILRRRLSNPTFVLQVDRNDLDAQLYDNFVAARSLVGDVQNADTVSELREWLQTEGGEVVFTTIEKFRLQEGEQEHPVLSTRRNIIVIADEAHRTQYGFEAHLIRDRASGEIRTAYGFAHYLRRALPNASFIGFTGTPIDLTDRDTQAVFGDVIHTYDIPQAQADKAVVPVYYEARLVKLHLVNEAIDRELEEITESEEEAEALKPRWSQIEAGAGTRERLAEIAQDLLAHFEARRATLFGKAMVVCMSRRICVGLYDEIVKLRPEWRAKEDDKGQIKIVMTHRPDKDPVEWNDAGHITTKQRREQIKARFRDPDDPLQLIIVRDMWLTGTDIPCLHTLYVDKPMKGHNLMQAISRVNRVFRDKPGGLVVDYIGVGQSLKEAASKFTSDGFGEPTQDLDAAGKAEFLKALDAIRLLLPPGVSVANWHTLSHIALEDLCARLYGDFIETDERRDGFLDAERRVSAAFSLVKHLPDVISGTQEVAFYQLIRGELNKTIPTGRTAAERDRAVRDLIDRSIASEGVVDIFQAAGITRPDISILDERFLEEFKSKEFENLRLKLLEKLVMDEIQARQRANLTKYRSFQEMLEAMLRRYHANAVTAAEVVQEMIRIRQEMQAEDRRKAETGLSDEELAFYDAVQGLGGTVYDRPFMCEVVRQVVQAVKRNLQVDWTQPHRENIKAAVRAEVKKVLRNRGIKAEQLAFILKSIMDQAEARYEDWPMAM
ncbi:MAG: type I restriction endonuclease subunit R [Anaerolineae bacterium]